MTSTNKKIKRLSIKSFVRKAVRIMLTIISILLACILILVGVLQLWSSRKTGTLRG